MTGILYILFYLGVLGLVGGCIAYLYVTRHEEERSPVTLPPEVRRKAEELSGTYNLHELETILAQLAAIEAWGVVLEIELSVSGEIAQMILGPGEVELNEGSLDPTDVERFRLSAANEGLEIRPPGPTGTYSVRITGTWSSIAETLERILRSRYGAVDGEEIQVRIF